MLKYNPFFANILQHFAGDTLLRKIAHSSTWGSSELDWCESNFSVTVHITEFWNTVSAFFQIKYFCLWSSIPQNHYIFYFRSQVGFKINDLSFYWMAYTVPDVYSSLFICCFMSHSTARVILRWVVHR